MNVICEPQTFRCGNCNRAWQERKDAERCCSKIEIVNESSITKIQSSYNVRNKRSEYYVPTPAQTTHEAFLQLFDYSKNTVRYEVGFFIKSEDRKKTMR